MTKEKEDTEKRLKEKAQLKRKSLLNPHRKDADIVAMFSHQKVVDPSKLTFIQHTSSDSRSTPVYSIKTEESRNVVQLGTEVNTIGEGYDYALAVLDKETGEISFRPAALYKFEARFAKDPSLLIGQRKAPALDYTKNYDLTAEERGKRRADLTENFGSSKKLKIQEAAIKRSINNDTLDAMLKTAFSSTSVIKDREDIKLEQISLVQQAQSAILPQSVQAELPKDIYPLSIFINEVDIEAFKDSCMEFMNKKKSELTQEGGFPDFIIKYVPSSTSKDPTRAVAYTLLGCMVQFLVSFGRAKSILRKVIDAMIFPTEIIQKVKIDYLNEDYDRGLNNRGAHRMVISAEQKERLTAYSLALYLTLSPSCSLPVTPWQQQLACAPSIFEKLLIALGCDIAKCSPEEAAKTQSLRVARLLRPPSLEKKKGIVKRRR